MKKNYDRFLIILLILVFIVLLGLYIKDTLKTKKSKPEKVCKLCRFYYENPRCRTGVPCNEWQLDKYRKEQLIINKFILMIALMLSTVIGIKVDSAVGGYSGSIAIVTLKQS